MKRTFLFFANLLLASSLNEHFAAFAEDGAIVCPRAKSRDVRTSLRGNDPYSVDFDEISGLAFSSTRVGRTRRPIVYAVNDSGGGRRMGIFDSGTGERLKSLRLPASLPLAFDFESMTVGSCGVDDGDCIYIADTGDNTARYSSGTKTEYPEREGAHPIYKIREPNIDDFEDNGIIPESDVTTLWFNYLHPSSPTPYADGEAVFLDHVGWGGGSVGDLYIITKWDDYGYYTANTLNRLFRIPAQVWTKAKANSNFVFSPTAVGYYKYGAKSNGLMAHQWTRAEMSPSGTVIALGDFDAQYLFLRCPGMSVAQSLAGKGTTYCETWPVKYEDSKFETIAWTPDGLSTLEISECLDASCSPPMVWTTMDYTFDPDNSIVCPTGAT